MTDPTTFLKSVDSAAKVGNTPLFTTIIDKLIGFKLSEWAAEGEVRKQLLHDEYEKAKKAGIVGMQYIEYLRHNENLINTAVKSTKYIDSSRQNDIKMDNDFFWNTVEYAKTISNNEIQELIARIIAGEYNNPGSYSMSTLHCLKMIGKMELELFEKVCSYLVNKNMLPTTLFSGSESSVIILKPFDIDFGKIQILQSLGLILPNQMTTRIENEKFTLKYFDKELAFEAINQKKIPFELPGYYALSNTGRQLLGHIKPLYNENYFSWLQKNYKIANHKLLDT